MTELIALLYKKSLFRPFLLRYLLTVPREVIDAVHTVLPPSMLPHEETIQALA